MPTIDYFLSTDIVLTKEDISTGLARELTPTLELGNDKRTWNKDQLKALTLIQNMHEENFKSFQSL
jgi:hypothetical protein